MSTEVDDKPPSRELIVLLVADIELTSHQVEAMARAYAASDGWLIRSYSRVWMRAPAAIASLARRGYLQLDSGRARLTDKGRALIELDPYRFGLKYRSFP